MLVLGLGTMAVVVTYRSAPHRVAARTEPEGSSGITRVVVHYGFMQTPNIPVALRLCGKLGLEVDHSNLTYYVGRETLIPTAKVSNWWPWRRHLFVFLTRNAMRNTTFYGLPPEDVVELGFQVEI